MFQKEYTTINPLNVKVIFIANLIPAYTWHLIFMCLGIIHTFTLLAYTQRKSMSEVIRPKSPRTNKAEKVDVKETQNNT